MQRWIYDYILVSYLERVSHLLTDCMKGNLSDGGLRWLLDVSKASVWVCGCSPGMLTLRTRFTGYNTQTQRKCQSEFYLKKKKNPHHMDMFYHSGLNFSIASYLAEWWRVVRCQLDGWDVQFEPRRFFSLQATGPACCLIHVCCLLLNLPAGQQMILKINHMLTDTWQQAFLVAKAMRFVEQWLTLDREGIGSN